MKIEIKNLGEYNIPESWSETNVKSYKKFKQISVEGSTIDVPSVDEIKEKDKSELIEDYLTLLEQYSILKSRSGDLYGKIERMICAVSDLTVEDLEKLDIPVYNAVIEGLMPAITNLINTMNSKDESVKIKKG